jgi:hypothetical protein
MAVSTPNTCRRTQLADHTTRRGTSLIGTLVKNLDNSPWHCLRFCMLTSSTVRLRYTVWHGSPASWIRRLETSLAQRWPTVPMQFAFLWVHCWESLQLQSVSTNSSHIVYRTRTDLVTYAVIESGAGIAEGGKTGLVGMTCGICFFISMFFAPIFASIPPWATGCTLVLVSFSRHHRIQINVA